MSLLTDLVRAIDIGSVEIVDLTAPLSSKTPILTLPEQFGQTWPFALTEISRYNDAGPAWYWNNISTGEHTGTHFDAPIHWITGKNGADVSQVPVKRLIAPAVVLDFADEAGADPDFLLEREHVEAWQDEHGPLPKGGWLLYRTGWDARGGDPSAFANEGRTPGISVACAAGLTITIVQLLWSPVREALSSGAPGAWTPSFWLGEFVRLLPDLTNLTPLTTTGAFLLLGITACLVLAPLALYFALSDE